MSRLQDLIQELCPDGVGYKKLNTVCKIYDGTHSTPQYKNAGIKFVSVQNINALYETDKYISEEDFKKFKITPKIGDVFMTRIGAIGVCAVVDRDESLAYYVSLALLRPDTEVLNSGYLKYIIESTYGRKELRKRTLVNAVPIKINKDDIGKIQIPVPPLPVQREIVRILDNFTELTAELQEKLAAELAARRKQYEYYKHIVLDINAPYFSLDEVCDIVDYRGKTPKKVDHGIFLVTAKNIRKGYIDYEKSQEYISPDDYPDVMRRGIPQIGDVLITTEAPCGNVAQVDKADIALAQRVIKYRPKDTNKLNATYLKHILLGTEFQNKLLLAATGGTVKGIKGSKLHKLTIPIPSLKEQQRVVDILDRFDTLRNDLTSGLPAEIAARQKQYEYYRDKLLTFQPLEKGGA